MASGSEIQFHWTYLSMACDPHCIPLYLGVCYSRKLVEPIVYMLVAIGVKRTFIGKFQPVPCCSSQYQLLQYWLAAELFPKEGANLHHHKQSHNFKGASNYIRGYRFAHFTSDEWHCKLLVA
jgi:hypothetical protein